MGSSLIEGGIEILELKIKSPPPMPQTLTNTHAPQKVIKSVKTPPTVKPRTKVTVIPKVLPEKLTPPATTEESPMKHRPHLAEEITPKESVEVTNNEVLNENTVAAPQKIEENLIKTIDIKAITEDAKEETVDVAPHEQDPVPVGAQTQDGRLLKQARGNRPITYPITLRRKGVMGTVILKYSVTRSGKVINMSVARSSGYKSLDNEAASTISNWRYKPGQGGTTTHPIIFRLVGPRQQETSRLRRIQ